MTRLKPLSVIDQAEISLRQALAESKWTDTLPSFATLSEFLGVSVPSVAIAVSRLAKAKLISSQGKRRRYRIEPKALRSRPRKAGFIALPSPRRYLLIVGTPERDQLDTWRARFVMEAMRELRRNGWVCDYDCMPFSDLKGRRASWDRVLSRHPATHLLILEGVPQVARWAMENGLTVMQMGGQAIAGVHTLGVELDQIIRFVVGKVVEAGHRKVLFPLLNAPSAMAAAVARSAGPLLGYTPDQMLDREWVASAQLRTPEERRQALAGLIRKLGPSVVICFEWRDYLVAADVVRELGLSCPGDLSLVVLDSNEDMAWVKPVPTRFLMGNDVMIKWLVALLKGKTFDAKRQTHAMIKGWTEGETLRRFEPSGA